MKIRHIKNGMHSSSDQSNSDQSNSDLWLVSKGNKVLYRGYLSPWKSPKVIASVLKREGKLLQVA